LYHEGEGDPPCKECRVELLEANEDIIEIYNLARNQVLIAPLGDATALNYATLIELLDLLEVEDKKETFFGVLHCYNIEQELAGKRYELFNGIGRNYG